MNFKSHWEKIYGTKKSTQVSWYQRNPAVSLGLIALTGISRTGQIIDVGGGASVLVDKLLNQRFENVTVLDISANAIGHAQKRLGLQAQKIHWIESDILDCDLPSSYDVWHDRAVFHFLTSTRDRKKYVEAMIKAVSADGHVIIGTFSLDGPSRCSGLLVQPYSPETLQREIGPSFSLVKSINEIHITPARTQQKFIYSYFKKEAKKT